MSSIYTGTGDDGSTSLADGTRVPKDDARVEAYGTLDEADALLGVARSLADDELLRELLRYAQQRLANCSSLLASPSGAKPGSPGVTAQDVAVLEAAIDRLEERTGPLTQFVLPGGSQLAASLHVARTVVRRAERRVAALPAAAAPAARADVLRFLNRLSDMLFAAARWANADQNRSDTVWDPHAPAPDIARFGAMDEREE